jgi:hypothetical protein
VRLRYPSPNELRNCGLRVSKRTIKLADLLKDAASPLSARADPKILLGVLDDASGLSVWHRYFHEIIAVVLLVVTLGAGFAFMPELSRSLPVRLVARFSQIEGYKCLSLTRALDVVKCQLALV